jgi:protein SCO1
MIAGIKVHCMFSKPFPTSVLFFLCLTTSAWAEDGSGTLNIPAKLMSDTALTQKMNAQIPGNLAFRDENGTRVTLSQYFGKPLLLQLVYYKCPNLCTMTMTGVLKALEDIRLNVGRDFETVFVSIDPTEKPALAEEKKRNYLRSYRVPGEESGVHLLTGDEPAIKSLADSVGYKFKYDEASGQYAHPATLIVLTPSGHVSRYLNGVDYKTRDVRLALVEASQNKIGNAVDQFLLFCFHYDPVLGKYGPMVMNLVRLFGALTVAGLLILIMSFLSKEKRRKRELLAETR